MLTRLRITGFKNLMDVDVHFGPFTCIAGANGVGKSNLFDAITFISCLADRSLIDAARSIRDEGSHTADIRSLFFQSGDQVSREMTLDAEMIVPSSGYDELGQIAHASITFLQYSLTLGLRDVSTTGPSGAIEVLREELAQINKNVAHEHLPFPHGKPWRDSVLRWRRAVPLITTVSDGSSRLIKQHQDGRQGRPLVRAAANLPRTVLSVANAAESPTALLARNEMRSWRLLQLEPSALRRSDELTAPTRMGADGSHLAATLYHLASRDSSIAGINGQSHDSKQPNGVYARIANRLHELIGDVSRVHVERDEKRELLTVWVTSRDGTAHPARSLSDGTLRFLALAVLHEDSEATGLLCLEEPENGIHPARIPAMLRLLRDIATDSSDAIDDENPLRQVIVNTHSPSVVKQVADDSLVVAELKESLREGQRFQSVRFSALAGTWRAQLKGGKATSIGSLLAYLHPEGHRDSELEDIPAAPRKSRPRVMDRGELQPYLIPPPLNA